MTPGDQSEYEAYVQRLYSTQIAPAVGHYATFPRRGHPFDELGLLARADAAVRLINATPNIYHAFRPEFLSGTLNDAANGVWASSHVLDEMGSRTFLTRNI